LRRCLLPYAVPVQCGQVPCTWQHLLAESRRRSCAAVCGRKELQRGKGGTPVSGWPNRVHLLAQNRTFFMWVFSRSMGIEISPCHQSRPGPVAVIPFRFICCYCSCSPLPCCARRSLRCTLLHHGPMGFGQKQLQYSHPSARECTLPVLGNAGRLWTGDTHSHPHGPGTVVTAIT
jgi:hypothetical protein